MTAMVRAPDPMLEKTVSGVAGINSHFAEFYDD